MYLLQIFLLLGFINPVRAEDPNIFEELQEIADKQGKNTYKIYNYFLKNYFIFLDFKKGIDGLTKIFAKIQDTNKNNQGEYNNFLF